MNTEILPYQRLHGSGAVYEKTRNRKNFWLYLSKTNIVIAGVSFLLGKASLAAGVMPFGMAIYAAALGTGANRLVIALFALSGMLLGGAKEQIYITIASMLLFNAFNIPFKNRKSRLNFRYATIGFISVLLPETVLVYLQGFLLYELLKAIFHAFIVFALVFILRNALPLLTDGNKRIVFSNEEIISVAIITALALSGLGSLQLLGFSVKNVMCIFVVLVFAYKCGPGVGAAIGVTVGLIVSMSTAATPLVIGSYAFCGLLSGVLRNLGKAGSGLGFVMGNAVLTLYLNGSTEVIIYLQEIITAVAGFLLIPQKIIELVAGGFSRNADIYPDKRSYSLRIKEITVEKLNKFSKAFKELSKTFSEISETKVAADKNDISSLFDSVADKVCKDCSLCLHCWDRSFYNTYQVMFKIVEKLEEKGRVEEADIPGYFIDRCERINDFVQSVNNIYELFKVNMVWKSRIGESRGLVSQQLDGLSKVVSNLASEIDVDVHFKQDLEDEIMLELNRAGVRADEVIVFENKWGKYEISVFHKGCGGKRSCRSTIQKLVSDVTGRKMVKEDSECYERSKGGVCNLKLVEEEVFRVTTGVARLTKFNSNVSGDSYTFMNTGDGKYILALSDGMGSGQKAAIQSRAAVSLLEQFMESGFDKDTAIRLINSILVLKSTDDSFATIDLAVIDLFDGETEFIKIGAVPTLIKRSERVEAVKSVSLPAGILSSIDTELVHKKVESGDFVIMMTDGVTDSFGRDADVNSGDESLQSFVNNIKSTNPQEIADMVLNQAYANCSGKPFDDMMVVVAKVWKRAPGI